MSVLAFARHALWLACGVYGAVLLPASVGVVAWVLADARRKRKHPRCLPPLKMSDAEFEAEVAEILHGAR